MKIKFSPVLIILVSILSSYRSFSQKNFKPGYVLLTEKDTLFGEIDYKKNELLSTKCKFRDEKRNIEVFNPDEIYGFRFSDGKFYISKKIKDKKLFLEYLIKGKVNIFMSQKGYQKDYYIDKEGEEINRIPFEIGTKYEGNTLMQYETTKHIGFLNFYMSDAPGMDSKIKSIKKPNDMTLIKLAKDYHHAVCTTEDCIIFENRLPFIKVIPEVVFGSQNFVKMKDSEVYIDPLTFQKTSMVKADGPFYGGLVHIWLPRANENFYLKTGFIYQNVKTTYQQYSINKIPIQLEYLYPGKFLKPRLAIGVTSYNPSKIISSTYSAGLNLKISKNSNLTINYDYEAKPKWFLALLPSYKFSDNYWMGFSYKF